jgi:hypothetical protein
MEILTAADAFALGLSMWNQAHPLAVTAAAVGTLRGAHRSLSSLECVRAFDSSRVCRCMNPTYRCGVDAVLVVGVVSGSISLAWRVLESGQLDRHGAQLWG